MLPTQTTTCPKETADLLVESFASVFTREEAINENCVLENMAEQINEFTVGKEEVVQQLNSLNIHKAAGPDSLHPVIIRTLAENETFCQRRYSPLSLQAAASTCCIPNPWKHAIVTALHKKVNPMMHAIIDLFLLLTFCVKYLRHPCTLALCVTTLARTNTALSTASRVSVIFWKEYMRSIPF